MALAASLAVANSHDEIQDKTDAFLTKQETDIEPATKLNLGIEPTLYEAKKEAQEYTRWASAMEKWGYTWKAFDVTTEDGYILTLFHILGTVDGGAFKPDKGTVLIQHGALQDAAKWIDEYKFGKPMPLILADQGYDIWMGNNRGTEYSRGNTKGLTIDMKEFWAWSYAEMGLYDDTANIKFIKDKTG